MGECSKHDDVIKSKHFPWYWVLERGIHRSPVNSPHKGQWRGTLMLPLICAWINGCASNREAGDLRRPRAHYDVTVMIWCVSVKSNWWYSFVASWIWSEAGFCFFHSWKKYLKGGISLIPIHPERRSAFPTQPTRSTRTELRPSTTFKWLCIKFCIAYYLEHLLLIGNVETYLSELS